MKKLVIPVSVSVFLAACAGGMGMSGNGSGAANPTVGGAPMSPGPFTVFAPTNAAFAALPAGTVDTLLKPENKPTLTKVLTYHVVPGKLDSAALMSAINAGGGKATLKTASGGTLTATMSGGNVTVTDAKGGTATVTIANVYQSNGVIHVVNKVLLPG